MLEGTGTCRAGSEPHKLCDFKLEAAEIMLCNRYHGMVLLQLDCCTCLGVPLRAPDTTGMTRKY
jgi:hypothetical protein